MEAAATSRLLPHKLPNSNSNSSLQYCQARVLMSTSCHPSEGSSPKHMVKQSSSIAGPLLFGPVQRRSPSVNASTGVFTYPGTGIASESPSHAAEERVGVILLNLGGPDTLNDVQPFLYNLFADPDIIRLPRLFRCLSLLGFHSLFISGFLSLYIAMAQEAQNGGAENGAAKPVVFGGLKPQLLVEAEKANDAVQFYKAAFGAEEVSRAVHSKRKADQELPLVLSAELKLGSSSFLVSADIAAGSDAPVESTGAGFTFRLETDDVAAAIAKAVAAGGVAEGEIAESEDAIGGGIVGKLKDPYGFIWMISSPAKKTADVEA